MSLENLIYTRKSCRKYLDEKISNEEFDSIKDFIDNAKRLNDSIEFRYEILTKDKVNIKTRWSAPYYLALYSEKKDNYMENIGFIFQQVSLYMQSLNIGNCWVGMAKPKVEKENFVIVISFGKSDDISRDLSKFKRKDLSKFSDFSDDRLKPAYYAPSAVNSQPWYFKHTSDGYDVYQIQQNIVKRKLFGKWNPIDVGIALAHLYIANRDTFKFEIKSDYENLKGRTYVGSISIW